MPVEHYVKKCPECGGINLFWNKEKGEIICRDCGLVVEEKMVDFNQEWREFDGDGQGDVSANCLYQFNGSLFDFRASRVGAGGDIVVVEFQGIRSGLLDELGMANPAARCDAVEGGDDGYADALFNFRD